MQENRPESGPVYFAKGVTSWLPHQQLLRGPESKRYHGVQVAFVQWARGIRLNIFAGIARQAGECSCNTCIPAIHGGRTAPTSADYWCDIPVASPVRTGYDRRSVLIKGDAWF